MRDYGNGRKGGSASAEMDGIWERCIKQRDGDGHGDGDGLWAFPSATLSRSRLLMLTDCALKASNGVSPETPSGGGASTRLIPYRLTHGEHPLSSQRAVNDL